MCGGVRHDSAHKMLKISYKCMYMNMCVNMKLCCPLHVNTVVCGYAKNKWMSEWKAEFSLKDKRHENRAFKVDEACWLARLPVVLFVWLHVFFYRNNSHMNKNMEIEEGFSVNHLNGGTTPVQCSRGVLNSCVMNRFGFEEGYSRYGNTHLHSKDSRG